MEAVVPAKRAHTYRPPLLSLWSRNELADNVVAFLPPDHLPKLPVISRPFRTAQPLVLFTAARRLKVVDQMLASCVDVLREAVESALFPAAVVAAAVFRRAAAARAAAGSTTAALIVLSRCHPELHQSAQLIMAVVPLPRASVLAERGL